MRIKLFLLPFLFLTMVSASSIAAEDNGAVSDSPEYLIPPGAHDDGTVLLKDVRYKHTSEGVVILKLTFSDTVTWGVMELQGPDRLILDIPSGKVSSSVKKNMEVNDEMISRIRIGPHKDKVRIVADLQKEIPAYDISEEGSKLVIRFHEKEIPVVAGIPVEEDSKVQIAEDDSEAETIVSDSKVTIESVADKKEVLVKDIQFKQMQGVTRISILVSSHVEPVIVDSGEATLAMEIAGKFENEGMERMLDVSSMEGPVTSVASFVDMSRGGKAVIAVRLREKAHGKISISGDTVNWDISQDAVKGGTKAIRYSRESTAAAPDSQQAQQQPQQAQESAAAAQPGSKGYKGKRISLDFKDADIHNLLRLISEVSKLNVITSDDVKGKVTVTLRNVPWDEALDLILQTKGLAVKQTGNILRIAPVDVFQREAENEYAKKKAQRNLEPLYVRLIPVNYGIASDIVSQVKDVLSERGTVSVDQRTNVIIVKDMQENVLKAESLIRNLDTQTPQVLIESRIVEANTTFIRDVGVQWGGNLSFSPANGNSTGLAWPNVVSLAGGSDDARTINPYSGTANPAGFAVNLPAPVGAGSGGSIGLILGNASGTANLNLRLSAMESTGDVKILSAPRITTLDNKEAKIGAGTSIPISTVSAAGVNTTFVEAKLELSVTPHVTQDGSILMKILTTKNEPDFSRTGAQGDPTILKKEATTEVLVKDGDTTVIGGIYTRKSSEEYAKVPWLANIPVIGWLFKKKKVSDERAELLIFITPRIINRTQSSLASE